MAWTQLVTTCVILLHELLKVHGSDYREVSVIVGHEAELPCTVDYVEAQVIWFNPQNTALTKNEEIITDDDRLSVEHPYANEYNLVIDGVRSSDAGNYTCMMTTLPPHRKYVNLNIVSSPKVTWTSGDTEEDTGSDVTVECDADGTPEPLIRWHRYTNNGEKIDLGVESPTLVLQNVSRYDAGTYECEADNGVPPLASATLRVDVRFAPLVSMPHQHISQEVGLDTFLQCTITANPHQSAYWQKDGVILTNSEKYRITEQNALLYNKSLFVFISDVNDGDFGNYECVAENDFGKASGSVDLIEYQSAHIRVVSPPEDAISSQGQNVHINCTVENMGNMDNIIWWHHHSLLGYQKLFESHPFSSPNKGVDPSDKVPVYIDTDKYDIVGHYNLVIKNVTLLDAGEYMCEVVGRKNYSASVTVVDELLCDNENVNKTHIIEGDIAMLSCSMAFSGPARVMHAIWLYNDIKLSSINQDMGSTMRRTVSLPVFATDGGNYSCLITGVDSSYQAECNAEIRVIGKEPTPAPLEDPWKIEMTTLTIIIVSCVGGTSLVFIILLIGVSAHYKKQLRKSRRQPPSVRYHRNGSVNLETSHLTASDPQEEEV